MNDAKAMRDPPVNCAVLTGAKVEQKLNTRDDINKVYAGVIDREKCV